MHASSCVFYFLFLYKLNSICTYKLYAQFLYIKLSKVMTEYLMYIVIYVYHEKVEFCILYVGRVFSIPKII
jgi:hypothetical protein